jgi:hypothetical protein
MDSPSTILALTAGCMAGLGDYLAQRQSRHWKYNPRRSATFIVKGLGEGIMWSLWYHWADRWVAAELQQHISWMVPQSPLYVFLRTLLSLFLDTCLACPIIYAIWDIPLPALLSGVPIRQIPQQVQSKLGRMILASLKLWIPANIFIYNIPLRYRLIFAATTDVVWQCIVSSIVLSSSAAASSSSPTSISLSSSSPRHHDEDIMVDDATKYLITKREGRLESMANTTMTTTTTTTTTNSSSCGRTVVSSRINSQSLPL